MLRVFIISLMLSLGACSSKMDTPETNPVLRAWTGPHQGVPPFDEIETKHFKPALEVTMAKALADYEMISNDTTTPTFENTIMPMERINQNMEKAWVLYSIWSSAKSDSDFQDVEKEMAPKLAEFTNKVMLNGKLFAKVNTLYTNRNKMKYTAEQKRLLWLNFTQFKKRGAALTGPSKTRVAAINKEMATLQTQFNQNQLADEENEHLHLTTEAQTAGLPQWLKDSAKEEASKRGKSGWVISNTRSSVDPFLTFSPNRELRKKAFKMFTMRGDNPNSNNNNAIVQKIMKLRAERSKLLGYPTYANWQLSDKMAKDPKKAMSLMMKVWKHAKAQVRKDVKAMQAIANKEKSGVTIEPWDYRFYAEKLRKQRYAFDMDTVKPYLQLENIRTAMFWMADKLYGFKFQRLNGVPVYHPDMSVYTVSKNGKVMGLWYFDPYARKGKRSGAWMNAYRIQNRMGGTDIIPIVSNNSNFIKAKAGEVTTISWDDASTMFHEFGHALHGLSSNVTYPSLAGTSTARDFVEFPSQIHEDWLGTPEVLKMLKNKEGKTLPQSLVKKLKRAKTFNEGFATTEYLASAIVDMKLHTLTDGVFEPKAFEKKTLDSIGMPKEIVMRHRIPHFGHLFSGEGYSAGYYSYLWSDVLRHDAFKAFMEAKGPYDKKVATKFQKHILSVGNTIDPDKAYRNFRGRGPKVNALLKAKGFIR